MMSIIQESAVNEQSTDMKYLLSKCTLLCMTACLALACKNNEPEKKDVVYVKTAEARGIGDGAELSYSGKTKSATDANVSFRVAGTIERMLVKKGDYVKKGQVIALLDARDYRTQLAAAEAEYKQVKADADRIEAMYAEQATTASNYDRARFGLAQMREKLNNCRNQVADCRLVAPMDGFVQELLHEAGETIGAGMPVVSLFQHGDIEVEVFIPAAEYARMDSLTEAFCTFDVLPGRELPLRVARLSREANASQLYEVRLSISRVEGREAITPGMSTMVTMRFQMSNADKGFIVPTSAILTNNGESYAFVYDKQKGTVRRVNVTVGSVDNEGNIRVLKGLHRADVVVSAGVRYLEDGMSVKPLEKPSASNVGGLL